jgi:hypothetical protein
MAGKKEGMRGREWRSSWTMPRDARGAAKKKSPHSS